MCGVTTGGHPLRQARPAHTVDAGEARVLVAGLLAPAPGGFGPGDAVIADALLVTSELVTNAFRHGGGLTGFAAETDGRTLTISVSDASSEAPRTAADHGALSEGGFGWELIHLLARRVSVDRLPGGGKTIEVTLALA
ncbi:ATP-binding protein [Streptomyces sp. NPDC060020]|uniref:ATP-binding protein n=1 Tax=Streptomyces sp. NPDC060020 TaxID=3347038 RepID=UPI0036812FE7